MKNTICLKLIAIFNAIVSVNLYGALIFFPIEYESYEYGNSLILFFSAHAFLLLTVIFIVCDILVSKYIVDFEKIKKAVFITVPVIIVACIGVSTYSYFHISDSYTSETEFDDKTLIQEIFPYKEVYGDKIQTAGISVLESPVSHYVSTSSYSTLYDYNVEYYKSSSPVMSTIFRFQKTYSNPLQEFETAVNAAPQTIKVDGIKMTVYVEKSNYAVLIKNGNETVYASLLYAKPEISLEEFAKEVIKQTDLLKINTEKLFLE